MTRLLTGFVVGAVLASALGIGAQDTTTQLSLFLSDLRAGTWGATQTVTTLTISGSAAAPGTPVTGMLYLDTTAAADELCVYDGANWQALSSGTDANCA